MPARPRTRASTKPKGGSTKRIPWGTLSRPQVIDAAMRLLTETGYEQLTIRTLAAELGTAPMSLYRHVRDKDDILDEVVDRMLEDAWQPSSPESDWKSYIREGCDKLRILLVAEAAALHVYLRHPVVSPASIARMDAMVRVLRSAGLSEAAAGKAFAALHTYTIGFAALEAGRAGWSPMTCDADDLAHRLARLTSPQQFYEGLEYLLDAIAEKVP